MPCYYRNFLRMVIEDNIENFPYWRIIDQNHSLVTKLNLNKEFIINQGLWNQ